MNEFKFIKKELTDLKKKTDFFSSLAIFWWYGVVILIPGILRLHVHLGHVENTKKNKLKADCMGEQLNHDLKKKNHDLL